MSDKIEIKIDAKRLTPDKFIEAATTFFGLVRGVAKNVSASKIAWGVEVDKGSEVVRLCAEDDTADSKHTIETVHRGIHSLNSGISVLPYGFTKDEVRA